MEPQHNNKGISEKMYLKVIISILAIEIILHTSPVISTPEIEEPIYNIHNISNYGRGQQENKYWQTTTNISGIQFSQGYYQISFRTGNETRTYIYNVTEEGDIIMSALVYLQDDYALEYNTTTISATKETQLQTGIQQIGIEFTNDTINLSIYVIDDEDSNKLNWGITGNNTNTIRVKILPNKILNISSAQDYYNEVGLNITFIAKDEEGLTANDTILIIVWSQNDPPTLNKSIPNFTIAEDSNTTINLSKYFSDTDNATLKYTATQLKNISVKISNITGTANLTPNSNFYGIDYIVFSATDGINTTKSNNITLNVTPVNDAPNISIPNITTEEDKLTTLDIIQYSQDIDNNIEDLTFTITSEDISMVDCNLTQRSMLSVIPKENWFGIANCSINVNDGLNYSSEDTFFIEVIPVNDAPHLNDLNMTINEDSGKSEINLTDYASDVDTDSLIFYVTAENVSEVDCNISDEILKVTPQGNYSGLANCGLVVSDSELNSSPAFAYVDVLPVNDAPVIVTYIPTDLTPIVKRNSTMVFNHTSSDVDDSVLFYNWFLDDVLKATTQSWIYVPKLRDGKSHNVSLSVSDGELNDTVRWYVSLSLRK